MYVGSSECMHCIHHTHINQHTHTQESTQRRRAQQHTFTQYLTILQPLPNPFLNQHYRSVLVVDRLYHCFQISVYR